MATAVLAVVLEEVEFSSLLVVDVEDEDEDAIAFGMIFTDDINTFVFAELAGLVRFIEPDVLELTSLWCLVKSGAGLTDSLMFSLLEEDTAFLASTGA